MSCNFKVTNYFICFRKYWIDLTFSPGKTRMWPWWYIQGWFYQLRYDHPTTNSDNQGYTRPPNGTTTRETSILWNPGARCRRTFGSYHAPWPPFYSGISARIPHTYLNVWRTHQNTYHRGTSTTQVPIPTTTSSLCFAMAMSPHFGNGHIRANITTLASNQSHSWFHTIWRVHPQCSCASNPLGHTLRNG